MQLIFGNHLLNGAGLGRLGTGRKWQDGEQGTESRNTEAKPQELGLSELEGGQRSPLRSRLGRRVIVWESGCFMGLNGTRDLNSSCSSAIGSVTLDKLFLWASEFVRKMK